MTRFTISTGVDESCVDYVCDTDNVPFSNDSPASYLARAAINPKRGCFQVYIDIWRCCSIFANKSSVEFKSNDVRRVQFEPAERINDRGYAECAITEFKAGTNIQ